MPWANSVSCRSSMVSAAEIAKLASIVHAPSRVYYDEQVGTQESAKSEVPELDRRQTRIVDLESRVSERILKSVKFQAETTKPAIAVNIVAPVPSADCPPPSMGSFGLKTQASDRNTQVVTANIQSDDEYCYTSPPMLLRICGIMPWCQIDKQAAWWQTPSAWYQWLILLFTVFATVHAVHMQLITWAEPLCYGKACLSVGLMSDCAIALGGLFGLLSVGSWSCSSQVSSCYHSLHWHAHHLGFMSKVEVAWRRDLMTTLAIWLLVAVTRMWSSGALAANGSFDVVVASNVAVFVVASGVVLGLSFFVLLFVRVLETVVDDFCVRLILHPSLVEAVCHWNVCQALLRVTSGTIERCLFVLLAVFLSATFSVVADFIRTDKDTSNCIAYIPCFLLSTRLVWMLFELSLVTDKCAHVPPFVNSLCFGPDEIDFEREYVVNYILNSRAGVYCHEVQVSSGSSATFVYFVGVVAFAMATSGVSF